MVQLQIVQFCTSRHTACCQAKLLTSMSQSRQTPQQRQQWPECLWRVSRNPLLLAFAAAIAEGVLMSQEEFDAAMADFNAAVEDPEDEGDGLKEDDGERRTTIDTE